MSNLFAETSVIKIQTDLTMDSSKIFLAILDGKIDFYKKKQQTSVFDMKRLT